MTPPLLEASKVNPVDKFFNGQGHGGRNGYVFMDRMDTRTAGDVFEPVHSSIKRKVHRVHSVHDVHLCPCP